MAAVLERVIYDEQINGTDHTSLDLGDAHPDRQVVFVITSRAALTATPTIGSITCKSVYREAGGSIEVSIWMADVPFGRSADLNLTQGTADWSLVGVWKGINIEPYDASGGYAASTNSVSATITVPSDTDHTIVAGHLSGGNGATVTWDNLDEWHDTDTDTGDTNDKSSHADDIASQIAAGEHTETVTSTSSESQIAIAMAGFRSANVAREIVVEATGVGSTATTAFECPAGTNLLAVAIGYDGTQPTNVTYDGQSLTLLKRATNGIFTDAEIWVLKQPPLRTSANVDIGQAHDYAILALSGTDLNALIRTGLFDQVELDLFSKTMNLGSLSDGVFLLDAFAHTTNGNTPTAASGQTEVTAGSDAGGGWGFSYKTVDSSSFDSMSWTFDESSYPSHVVAAFQPQRNVSPAYQYEEVEGTLSRMDFNYGFNDQGPYRSRWTKESSPTFASGVATFDGVDDYLDGPAFDFAGNGIFTFSLWARTTTISGDDCYFSVHGNTNTTYAMLTNSNGKVAIAFRNSTSNSATSTSVVNDGDWHHIVGMGDGSTVKIFVDGVFENTTTITASTFTPTGSRIGSRNSFNPEYYPGDMADVRIFNRPLTNAEVSDLYARGRNNLPVRRTWDSDPDLVGHYTSKVSIGTDQSGNGYHLTNEDASPSPAETNGGLYFDGGNDWYSMNGLSVDLPLTLALWVRADAATSMAFISSDSNTSSYIGTSTSNRYRFGWNGITQSLINIPSPVNDWHHVAQTIDTAGNSTYYIDGEEAGTGTGGTSGAHTLQLGKVTSFSPTMNGAQDDIRIYKRVLTNSEIRELYNLTDRHLGISVDPIQRRQLHGCVGHWRASSEGRDLSGNGNHLSYSGDFSVNGGVWSSDTAGDTATISDDGTVAGFDNQSFTVSFRMRVRTSGLSNKGLVEYQDLTGSPLFFGFKIEVNSDDIEFKWNDGTTFQFIRATSNLVSADTWYLVTCVFASGRQEIWMDDSIVASATRTDTITFKSDPVILGSSGYDGYLDDLQIYNRALTNAEILWLYQSGTPYRDAPEQRALSGQVRQLDAAHEAIDVLGNGHGGHYNGDVSSDGTEWTFDGTGDYIEWDEGSPWEEDEDSPFTVSAWVNTADTSTFTIFSTRINGISTSKGFDIYRDVTSGSIQFDGYNAGRQFGIGTTTPSVDTWYHVVATWDGSTATLYINGSQDATNTPSTGLVHSSEASIGSWNAGHTSFVLNGSMKDIKVFKRALSAEEVSLLYNGGTSGYVPSANHLEAPYQAIGRWCPTIADQASDLTDNQQGGTYAGDAATVTEYSEHGEKSYELDGTGDDIEIPNAPLDAYPMAMMAWFNLDTVASDGNIVVQGDISNTKQMMGFGCSGANSKVRIWTYNNSFISGEGSVLSADTWYHGLAVYRSDTDRELFLNAVSDATLTTSQSLPTNMDEMRIGQSARSTDDGNTDGEIDDTIILLRDPHQAEINWISSERGIVRPYDPYNPVAWWCPSLDFPNVDTLNLMDLSRNYHGDFESGMSASDDWVVDTNKGGVRSIDFDGTDDYVDVGSGLFNGWTQMSVSAWFNADALPTRGCVLAQMGSGSDFNFEFGPATSTTAGNEAAITIHDGTTQWKTFSNTTVPTGEWVHLAATWDGTDLNIYFNGVDDSNVNTAGSAGGSIRDVSLTTRIGEYERDSEHFDGKVDDVRVYDKALPIEAIKNLSRKRGWTPEETTTITTAGDAAAATIFPFWAIIDNNNSFG